MSRDVDTLIVGASAAGLATAACLGTAGRSFEILEAGTVVGQAWRNHYDRLHLHTPKSASALPGLAMPTDWPRYSSRDQFVDYLTSYCAHHHLEPNYDQRIIRLERLGTGWRARSVSEEWHARHVVLATGANRRAVRPIWPGMESFGGEILHSRDYRNGDPWKGRSVLVIGFGNSACEIAIDLAERGARPHLAVRSPVNVIPRDVFRLVPVLQLAIAMRHLPAAVADAFSWPIIRLTVGDIRKVGLRKLPYGPNSQIVRDRQVPLLDIGTLRLIRAGQILLHGDVARFTKQTIVFADGETLDVDAVILGTGFRPDFDEFLVDWREVCDKNGLPRTSGAPTALPGLYFCGQQPSRSGMLRQIGIEARQIAAHIAA